MSHPSCAKHRRLSFRCRCQRRAARLRRRRTRQNKDRTRSQRRLAALAERDYLLRLRDWLLPESLFTSLRLHANTTWTTVGLVWLALCWSWMDSPTLTDAFHDACLSCTSTGVACLRSYQGLLGALLTWTGRLIPLLCWALQQRMEHLGSPSFRFRGFVPLAFDGSRCSTPRTRSNEKAFCAPNYGKGRTARSPKKKSQGLRRQRNQEKPGQPPEPQVWTTLIWHMGLRLPWCWRLGPSNACEREDVMQMLQTEKFPSQTLFCGDAGFVGYPLWSLLVNKHHMLVRVGANVHLLLEHADCQFEEQGEHDYRVLCWPRDAVQAEKRPLRLRLLHIQVGRTWMWMLTDVLDEQQLSKEDACRLYQMRWGVEVEFRGLKQTLERRKLRCRNAQRVLVELQWSMVAMAVLELFALQQQQQARVEKKQPAASPEKRSLAKAARALRRSLAHPEKTASEGQDLFSRLAAAVTDDYQRHSSKKARYQPPNPDKKPLGTPKVRHLKVDEVAQLQEFASAAAK